VRDKAANSGGQSQLQQLHAKLIDPISQFLPTEPDEPVMFLPHAELFMVPFAALQDSSGRYLIEKHTLVSAPSVQVLQHTGRQRGDSEPDGDAQILIVGDPKMPALPPQFGDATLSQLPGTEQEARRIAALFETEALVGQHASETDVTRRMASARIIHLATHGLLDDFGSGIPGAIALASSEDDDGLLTAMEIFQMRLRADLVVLSACDTGLGRITGDGVVGLSRSLIAAGAASAVVSLWQVPDDPTALLMIAFYENLTQGMSKAEALRHAMLATMGQHPDPYNWAAFTLIGEID
jgi:CHAT domain-containing protein